MVKHKEKYFALFTSKCRPADDSLIRLAVAKAILERNGDNTRLETPTDMRNNVLSFVVQPLLVIVNEFERKFETKRGIIK